MPVPTFEAFEIELQNTLYNLSDPLYTPEACVFQIMDIQPAEGIEGIRRKIIEVIEWSAQNETVSDTAKITFLFKVLHYRFVQSLSQERAAEELDISSRHLRRKQSEAIRALAMRLWNRSPQVESPSREDRPEDGLVVETGGPERAETESGSSWAEMVLHEIEVLNSRSIGMITTDLEQVVQKTIEMARLLHNQDGLLFEIEAIPPGIEVAVHPNVLRQVILYILQQAAQIGYTGRVMISVLDGHDFTTLSFLISNLLDHPQPEIPNINELAAVLGGKAEIRLNENCCTLNLVFPKSRKKSVLVVDDNFETVQLFRRYTTHSRFEIHHSPSGVDLQKQINAVKPDILVIDILLPGQDGWDLLLQIRENPETVRLPVIVSSVLGDPEIARSLGANIYLPKPVDQKTFLRALEEAAAFS